MPLPEFSSHIAPINAQRSWAALHLEASAKEEFLKVVTRPLDKAVMVCWSTNLDLAELDQRLPSGHEAKVALHESATVDPKTPIKEVVYTTPDETSPDIIFRRMGRTMNMLYVNVDYSETTIISTPDTTAKQLETLLQSTASFNVSRHASALLASSIDLLRKNM